MKPVKLLVYLVLLLVPCVGSAQQFDEQAVRTLLSEIDVAIAQKDADAFGRFLSDKVAITATVRVSGQTQNLTMDKSGYIESLKQGWAAATEYTYERTSATITVSGPASATVTATIVETMTVHGQTILSTTTETATIELVDGKPVITKLVGDSAMTREQRADAGPRPRGLVSAIQV